MITRITHPIPMVARAGYLTTCSSRGIVAESIFLRLQLFPNAAHHTSVAPKFDGSVLAACQFLRLPIGTSLANLQLNHHNPNLYVNVESTNEAESQVDAFHRLRKAYRMAHEAGEADTKNRHQTPKDLKAETNKINRTIDRYNLAVPGLYLQPCHNDADTAIDAVMRHKRGSRKASPSSPEPPDSSNSSSSGDDGDWNNADKNMTAINAVMRHKRSSRKASSSLPKPPDSSNSSSSGDDGISDNYDENLTAIDAVMRHKRSSRKASADKNSTLWNPRYMAELMVDFYRELARAYVSMMRGFKNHK